MSIVLDLTGRRFGKWKVLRRYKNTNRGQTRWVCFCGGCNRNLIVTAGNLRSGRTSSCQQCSKRLPDGEASPRSLYREYRQGAKERELSFRLSLKQFKKLTSDLCHYCGTKPEQIWKRGETNGYYVYNGIDRMNNSRGYSLRNCVSCCGNCNKAKRITDYQPFLKWIRRVYEWRQLGETC